MKNLFLAALVVACLCVPATAYANDSIGEGEEGTARALGWVAIACGLLANIPLMLYARVKKMSVVKLGGGDEITRGLAMEHRPVLNVHMTLNLVGFGAGVAHGIALLGRLDAISLSLAIIMTVLTASGIFLRFSKIQSIKLYLKIMHTQLILSGVLVALIALHVAYWEI